MPKPRGDWRSVLWLGAHKTGTTYLQGMLDASADTIRPLGVAYENLEEFRRKFTRPLLGNSPDAEPAPPSKMIRGDRLTIVFDENVPSVVQDAIRPNAGLYPNAERRIQRLIGHLEFDPDAVIVGIRPLGEYLPSLYCETLKSTPYRSFADFMTTVPDDLSWYAYLSRIADLFPDCRVFVYSTQELHGHEKWLLEWVTGVPEHRFTVAEGQERPGFSHATVEALEALAATREVTREDVFHLVREYPKSKEHPGFSPFSAEERTAFEARFERDLEAVRKDDRMRRPLRNIAGRSAAAGS